MLVFIDESGDAGFRLDKGSSPDFVVAMVIIESAEHARETEAAIQSVRRQLGLRGEFKFSKLKNEWRDVFFQRLRSCPFSVRAIVVQKDLIYSPHLRAKKDDFHRFFVQKMVMHDGGLLDRAKVVVDGSGDRKFQDSFRSYLRKHAKERIESVRFVDSKTDQLVQLADMCVGAIARSYKWDKKDAARWRDALQARIDDVWDSDRCAPRPILA